MKTTLNLILAASLTGSLLAQTPPAPAPVPPVAPATPAQPAAPAVPIAPAAVPVPPVAAPAPVKVPVKRVTTETEKGMRLNFRGVPLEMVLDYFSEAAGFIIVPKTDIRGRVDVWSEDSLTKDEAVEVLNNVLSRNGYAAFRSGRSLHIINKDELSRKPLPVNPTPSDPEKIPPSENMVTQILPVKFISAEQLIKNLDSLLPTSAIVTANAGANALVITDTQVNIKRVAEIIKALDNPVASVSSIKVFPLKYADAKAISTVVKDLFAPDTSSAGGRGQQGGVDPRQQFFQRFGGGGGSAGGASGSSAGGGRVNTPKIVATADELSNSLIVSAPAEQIPIIEDLVKQVDVPVEDVTEVKVFRLKYASADETATLIKNLFPDTATQGTGGTGGRSGRGGTGGSFFGFRPPGSTGGSTGGASGSSERMLKQNRVVAVADNRTASVIVTASPPLMEQITGMITQLDGDPSKQQKVFVIPVENADPEQLQHILQSLFPTQSGRSSTSSSQSGRSGFGAGTTTRNNGGQSSASGRNSSSSGRNSSSGFGGSSSGSGFGTTRGN